MIYLLVDTCSWRKLITYEKVNPQILQLQSWVNEGEIGLLFPKALMEEWNKHKNKIKEDVLNEWKQAYQAMKPFKSKISDNTFLNINPNHKLIDEQVEILNKLINQSKIDVDISNEVKALILDKIESRKAPFHHDKESRNDARIYFSTLEYCKNNGITNLFFISDNPKDFGEPMKDKKGSLTKIHPQLLLDFPEINVEYHGAVGKGIHELSMLLPSSDINSDLKKYEKDSHYNYFDIDKDQHILDQLYQYLNELYKEVNFVPVNILKNHYPLKESATNYNFYSTFTLYISNQELFKSLVSVDIIDKCRFKFKDENEFKNVKDLSEKTKFILSKLSNNLVYNIVDDSTNKLKSIEYFDSEICTCLSCEFERFNFLNSLKMLSRVPDNLIDSLEHAYLHYQFGNFTTSAQMMKKIYEDASNQKMNTIAFIALFNLSKLSIFTSFNNLKEKNPDLFKYLKEIDLSKAFSLLATKKNEKIITWLNNGDFFSKAKDKVSTLTSKIIDAYYASHSGSERHNSYVLELINFYAEILLFLSKNHIIYDKFLEFKELSKLFIEGLLASFATKETSSGLSKLNHWMIHNLLLYGKSGDINKFINRYKIKNIVYEETSSRLSLKEIILNFFNDSSPINQVFNTNYKIENRKFWEFYNELFCNILTVVSIINFDKSYLNKFIRSVLVFLESEEVISRRSIGTISNFILRIGEKINPSALKGFFSLALKKSKFHDRFFFEDLNTVINRRKVKIVISQKNQKIIEKHFLNSCKSCNNEHDVTIIVSIFLSLEDCEFKERISEYIIKKLNDKFNYTLFYNATIRGAIACSENTFNLAVNNFLNKVKSSKHKSSYNEHKNREIQELINISYKYNFLFSDTQKKKLSKFGNYYLWLLDMDNFNYDKFDPNWINEYKTTFYYDRIKKSNIVKDFLENYLKSNNESIIEKTYIDLFIRDY